MSTTADRAATRPEPTTRPAGLSRTLAWVLTVGGLLGTFASLALLLDRIALLRDPAFVPACSINATISCGSVLSSPQSEVFGFPNPLIGVAAFPVVATLGTVTLAGAVLARWIWWGLQAGATAGLAFVVWLIGQSLFVIGALCPYCMIVWVVTISIFWYVTLHTVVATRPPEMLAVADRIVLTYHSAVLATWLLALTLLVVARFWPDWTGATT